MTLCIWHLLLLLLILLSPVKLSLYMPLLVLKWFFPGKILRIIFQPTNFIFESSLAFCLHFSLCTKIWLFSWVFNFTWRRWSQSKVMKSIFTFDCHILVVWLWVSYVNFLIGLHFLICNIGLMFSAYFTGYW